MKKTCHNCRKKRSVVKCCFNDCKNYHCKDCAQFLPLGIALKLPVCKPCEMTKWATLLELPTNHTNEEVTAWIWEHIDKQGLMTCFELMRDKINGGK